MAIDYETRLLAYKILIIVFIIITIVVNAEYLFRYLRAPKVLYRAGHFGKIILAVGNIFLALFSYAILAKIYFEDASDLTCRSILTSTVFQLCFFPFVVGFSIFSSSLNIYLSQRQFWTSMKAKLMSFGMAAFPWLLALLVVCPLAFSGTHWDYECHQDFSLERMRAIYGISVILPALVAVLFNIVLLSVRSTIAQQPFIPMSNPLAEATAPNASPNTNGAMSNGSVPPTAAPNASDHLTFQQFTMERRGLLRASLIFFISALPYTIFTLGYTLNDDPDVARDLGETAAVIIHDICFWILFLYPVLLPITWRSQVNM